MVNWERVKLSPHHNIFSPIDFVPPACASWRVSLLNDNTGLDDAAISSIKIPTLLVRSYRKVWSESMILLLNMHSQYCCEHCRCQQQKITCFHQLKNVGGCKSSYPARNVSFSQKGRVECIMYCELKIYSKTGMLFWDHIYFNLCITRKEWFSTLKNCKDNDVLYSIHSIFRYHAF